MRSCEGGGPRKLWHCRLGHLDVKSIYALKFILRDINLSKTSHPTFTLGCEACTKGKQYATKLGNNAQRLATKPLKILHSDDCSPHKEHIHGRENML